MTNYKYMVKVCCPFCGSAQVVHYLTKDIKCKVCGAMSYRIVLPREQPTATEPARRVDCRESVLVEMRDSEVAGR